MDTMNVIWGILMVAVVIIIGLMLQRVFQGPTIYDRMNGLGVIGADTNSVAGIVRLH